MRGIAIHSKAEMQEKSEGSRVRHWNIKHHTAAAVALFVTNCGSIGMQSPATTAPPSPPIVIYGSQSGQATLDRDSRGGNPFATGLIELLERESLTYDELRSDLVALTSKNTGGHQVPEAVPNRSLSWTIRPVSLTRRTALVFVYSDYSSSGMASLPGAETDLNRVTDALRGAGFDVETLIDPSRSKLGSALETLSRRSLNSEAAIIYATGHGFERRAQTYLIPNDVRLDKNRENLPEVSLDVVSFARYLKATSANLVLFAGCRSPIWDGVTGLTAPLD